MNVERKVGQIPYFKCKVGCVRILGLFYFFYKYWASSGLAFKETC